MEYEPEAEPEHQEPEQQEEVAPYVRFLSSALHTSIDRLVRAGQLEVTEEQRPFLHRELVEAAAHAETPKRMLKKLVKSLVNSEYAEEVFATDAELREVFAATVERV